MAKPRVEYVCESCGGTTVKWQGRCPHCGQWNTMKEFRIPEKSASRFGTQTARSQALIEVTDAVDLSQVKAGEVPRTLVGIEEFDRVLGGGLVSGGVTLIGGDPGIGKSTLLLQATSRLVAQGIRCLYVTGEESASQVALRAKRLGIDPVGISLMSEIEVEKIEAALIRLKPTFVVIDSIQTLFSSALESAPGSVTQVRECSARLTRLAKTSDITLVFVGHVTKEGSLAGPRILEHIVDTVLYFEGDSHSNFRLVRAFKNRFGAVNELGVFAMTDKGLRGISDPSASFLAQHEYGVAGSVVMVTQEGTRPLLVEVQALVDPTHSPSPKRLCVGLDGQRLSMLLAVLHRHAGISCFDQDVFINAVGGVKITEPASDLAVILAVVSSVTDKAISRGTVVFGEVGLAGEIRPAPRGQERLKEAAKLGFARAVIPKANAPKIAPEGLTVIAVDRLSDAIDAL